MGHGSTMSGFLIMRKAYTEAIDLEVQGSRPLNCVYKMYDFSLERHDLNSTVGARLTKH